jgi:hypothetical protein
MHTDIDDTSLALLSCCDSTNTAITCVGRLGRSVGRSCRSTLLLARLRPFLRRRCSITGPHRKLTSALCFRFLRSWRQLLDLPTGTRADRLVCLLSVQALHTNVTWKKCGRNGNLLAYEMGHTVAQWLRRYATSRKVAGSRPNEVNIFNLPNPSSGTKPRSLLIL